MPTKVSIRQKQFRFKEMRKNMQSKLHIEQYKNEIRQEIANYRNKKESKISDKKCKEKTHLAIISEKEQWQWRHNGSNKWRFYENKWTGLRSPPNNGDHPGFNWMTFFCLNKKKRNGRYIHFPNHLMNIINSFLNWIPAGCWNSKSGCSVCGTILIDDNFLLRTVCSEQCNEIVLRKVILTDFDNFKEIVEQFKVLIDYSTSICSFDEDDIGWNCLTALYDPIFYQGWERIYYRWANSEDQKELCRRLDLADKWGYSSVSSESSCCSCSYDMYCCRCYDETFEKMFDDLSLLEYSMYDGDIPYRDHWSEDLIYVFH